MGDVFIVDMTHYEGLPPHLAEGPAGRIAHFFGSIVSASSVSPLDVVVDSALFCRRRPGRRKCPGHLKVCRNSTSGIIEWYCSSCDDQGTISNWEGTSWDLSKWVPHRSAGQKLYKLVLAEEELRELRHSLVLSRECDCLIYGAVITHGTITIRATLEELDDLQGYVAAEANHEEKKRRRNILDSVYDKVEAPLGKHFGENPGIAGQEESRPPQLSSMVQRFLDELEKRFSEGQNYGE